MKLPDEPKKGDEVFAWIRKLIPYLRATRITSVVGGRLRESASGTSLEILFPKQPTARATKPPLWITLRAVPAETAGDPPTWEVIAEYGHVVPRHNGSGDTGGIVAITSLPTNDSPLEVIEDTKLWVKQTISIYGKVTAAAFDSGTSWPTDTPPVLIGGDDQTGAVGYRHIRIAEIIANPDSEATPPPLIRKQLHTGHIDHFQPEMVENTSNSMSTSEARVLKQWNTEQGRWDLRYLKGVGGISISEDGDSIQVSGSGISVPSHPWKATENGTEFITIAPGELLCARTSSGGGYPFYWENLSYAGGDIEVTGNGYILISAAVSEEEAGGTNAGDAGILSSPSSFIVEFQTTIDAVSDSIGFPICQVAFNAGIATVTKQILTHNPSPSVTWISPAP
jgi:hypothetical protein